jgi:hypothetical protein
VPKKTPETNGFIDGFKFDVYRKGLKTMDEHKVERTDEGFRIVLKTDAYRLSITDDNFAYLTDINSEAGCTCHLREIWDIQNLRALLDEAEKILQERELADAAKNFDEGFDDIPFPSAADDSDGLRLCADCGDVEVKAPTRLCSSCARQRQIDND